MWNFLIDECLSVALVDVARAQGHRADHVSRMGWSGIQDWNLMSRIEAGNYLFVTNNRLDFLALHGKTELHEGLIVIVPNVARAEQIRLFGLALNVVATLSDLVNQVLEIGVGGSVSVRPLADHA